MSKLMNMNSSLSLVVQGEELELIILNAVPSVLKVSMVVPWVL